MSAKRGKIHKNVKAGDWIEVKYNGETYLVAVTTLLDAFNKLWKRYLQENL